jgi:hypothetical protein
MYLGLVFRFVPLQCSALLCSHGVNNAAEPSPYTGINPLNAPGEVLINQMPQHQACCAGGFLFLC